MKKLTALFVISFQQVVFGPPEPDRTPRSISQTLFSRSAAFLAFLDLHGKRDRCTLLHWTLNKMAVVKAREFFEKPTQTPDQFYRSTQTPRLNEFWRTLNGYARIELNEWGLNWMDARIELDKYRQGINWIRFKLTRIKLKGN